MNATVKQVLDCLNANKIRATYPAVQSYLDLGSKNLDWENILGPNRKYASWVVSKKTGMPEGYDSADLHPDLLKTEKIIAKGRQLQTCVEEFAKQMEAEGADGQVAACKPKLIVADCHGNNCAVICPSCNRPYVVSGFLDKGIRSCPHCNGSKAVFTELKAEWEATHQDALISSEQEATRLIFKKDWLGYDVWVTFTEDDTTYRYPHDQLLQTFISRLGIIENTKSWKTTGIFHFPRLSVEQKKMLQRYLVEPEEEAEETPPENILV